MGSTPDDHSRFIVGYDLYAIRASHSQHHNVCCISPCCLAPCDRRHSRLLKRQNDQSKPPTQLGRRGRRRVGAPLQSDVVDTDLMGAMAGPAT
ncbi:MAG: hypothetical protein K8T91_24905 [Planctomycetes bacterium]|nr:hypothetical protein [Planctomycetota bacterium]